MKTWSHGISPRNRRVLVLASIALAVAWAPGNASAGKCGKKYRRCQPICSDNSCVAGSSTSSSAAGTSSAMPSSSTPSASSGSSGGSPAHSHSKPPSQWPVYTSPDGGYSIKMVHAPKTRELQAATGAGTLTVHMAYIDHGNIAYSADYAEIPTGGALQPMTMIDTMVQQYNGQNLSVRDVSLGDVAGKEATFDVPGKSLSVRVRVFIVGNRQYRVMLVAPRNYLTSEDAETLFSSFQLTK